MPKRRLKASRASKNRARMFQDDISEVGTLWLPSSALLPARSTESLSPLEKEPEEIDETKETKTCECEKSSSEVSEASMEETKSHFVSQPPNSVAELINQGSIKSPLSGDTITEDSSDTFGIIVNVQSLNSIKQTEALQHHGNSNKENSKEGQHRSINSPLSAVTSEDVGTEQIALNVQSVHDHRSTTEDKLNSTEQISTESKTSNQNPSIETDSINEYTIHAPTKDKELPELPNCSKRAVNDELSENIRPVLKKLKNKCTSPEHLETLDMDHKNTTTISNKVMDATYQYLSTSHPVEIVDLTTGDGKLNKLVAKRISVDNLILQQESKPKVSLTEVNNPEEMTIPETVTKNYPKRTDDNELNVPSLIPTLETEKPVIQYTSLKLQPPGDHKSSNPYTNRRNVVPTVTDKEIYYEENSSKPKSSPTFQDEGRKVMNKNLTRIIKSGNIVEKCYSDNKQLNFESDCSSDTISLVTNEDMQTEKEPLDNCANNTSYDNFSEESSSNLETGLSSMQTSEAFKKSFELSSQKTRIAKPEETARESSTSEKEYILASNNCSKTSQSNIMSPIKQGPSNDVENTINVIHETSRASDYMTSKKRRVEDSYPDKDYKKRPKKIKSLEFTNAKYKTISVVAQTAVKNSLNAEFRREEKRELIINRLDTSRQDKGIQTSPSKENLKKRTSQFQVTYNKSPAAENAYRGMSTNRLSLSRVSERREFYAKTISKDNLIIHSYKCGDQWHKTVNISRESTDNHTTDRECNNIDIAPKATISPAVDIRTRYLSNADLRTNEKSKEIQHSVTAYEPFSTSSTSKFGSPTRVLLPQDQPFSKTLLKHLHSNVEVCRSEVQDCLQKLNKVYPKKIGFDLFYNFVPFEKGESVDGTKETMSIQLTPESEILDFDSDLANTEKPPSTTNTEYLPQPQSDNSDSESVFSLTEVSSFLSTEYLPSLEEQQEIKEHAKTLLKNRVADIFKNLNFSSYAKNNNETSTREIETTDSQPLTVMTDRNIQKQSHPEFSDIGKTLKMSSDKRLSVHDSCIQKNNQTMCVPIYSDCASPSGEENTSFDSKYLTVTSKDKVNPVSQCTENVGMPETLEHQADMVSPCNSNQESLKVFQGNSKILENRIETLTKSSHWDPASRTYSTVSCEKHRGNAASMLKNPHKNVSKMFIQTNNLTSLILQWKPSWLSTEEEKLVCPPLCDCFSHVKDTYQDSLDYYNTFFPLHVLSIWLKVSDCWKKSTVIYKCELNKIGERMNFVKVECSTLISVTDYEKWPKRDDFVLITRSESGRIVKQLFGCVTGVMQRDHRPSDFELLSKPEIPSPGERWKQVKFNCLCTEALGIQTCQYVDVRIICNLRIDLLKSRALKSKICCKGIVLNPMLHQSEMQIIPLVPYNDGTLFQKCIGRIIEFVMDPQILVTLVDTSTTCDSISSISHIADMIMKSNLPLLICAKHESFLELADCLKDVNLYLAVKSKDMKMPEKFKKFLVHERLSPRKSCNFPDTSPVVLTVLSLIYLEEITDWFKEQRPICIVEDAHFCTETDTALLFHYNVKKMILMGRDESQEDVHKVLKRFGYGISLFRRLYQARI